MMQFQNLEVIEFGSSHGKGVGILIRGLDPGLFFDELFLKKLITSYYKNALRKEEQFEVLSGVNEKNYTDGTPLILFFKNKDIDSKTYEKQVFIPNHGIKEAKEKYKNGFSFLGSSILSGRVYFPFATVPAFLEEELNKKKLFIETKITKVYNLVNKDENFFKELGQLLKENPRESYSSVVEARIKNLPKALGREPFGKLDSVLSYNLFSIPGVKQVTFGNTDLLNLKGSKSLDKNKDLNFMGGLEAGMTTGKDIVITVLFKPVPATSILKGRHDQILAFKGEKIIKGILQLFVYDLLKTYAKENS